MAKPQEVLLVCLPITSMFPRLFFDPRQEGEMNIVSDWNATAFLLSAI